VCVCVCVCVNPTTDYQKVKWRTFVPPSPRGYENTVAASQSKRRNHQRSPNWRKVFLERGLVAVNPIQQRKRVCFLRSTRCFPVALEAQYLVSPNDIFHPRKALIETLCHTSLAAGATQDACAHY